MLNAQHYKTLNEWLNGKVTHNIGVFLDKVQNARAHHKKGNVPVTPEGISNLVYKCRCCASLQRSYRNDSSRTAQEVLEDTWRNSSTKFTLAESSPFWWEQFGRESPEATECPP